MSSVHEMGTLEASRSEDVSSPAQIQTTLISIVPEGTRVKKGDVIGELDSASLRYQLVNQRITTKSAEANFQNAKLTREVAEIAVREYEEGIYRADRATVVGEIKLAESALSRAQGRVERLKNSRQKLTGLLNRKRVPEETSGDILAEVDLDDRLDSAEQDRLREQLSLEKVQGKLSRLDTYTKPKMVKELQGEVVRTLSNELVKRNVWQLEKDKEANLEQQIVASRLVAPCSGRVVYANSPLRPSGRDDPRIQVKDQVREGDLIMRIADIDAPLLVRTRVHESQVDRVRPGQKARIEVHAFTGESLSGTVVNVASLPDPAHGPRNAVPTAKKVFTAMIQIEKANEGLRPGMSATIAIPIAERDNVVNIAVSAVRRYDDKDHVAVRRPDGTFEWRPVTLGDLDETGKSVEIKEGLKPGERVALIWQMSQEDNRRFVPTVKPAGTKADPGK